MTDLRDGIAAAISGVDDWRGVTDPAILADAVIAALGLTEEFTISEFPDGTLRKDRRYATPWSQYKGCPPSKDCQLAWQTDE